MKKRRMYLLTALMAAMLCTTSVFTSEASGTDAKSFTAEREESPEIYKEGQALVLYKSGVATSKTKALKALDIEESVQVEKLWQFETSGDGNSGEPSKFQTMGNTESVSVGLVTSKTLSTKQLIAKLEKEDNVEAAEPNYRLHTNKTDDAYFGKQWSLENIGQNGGIAGSSTNISEKWKNTKGSDEVVVAVVDTGVDYTHEDLKDNMWENTYQPSLKGEHGFDFINGDSDPMDDNGHGTHCAGIIGAKGDNGVGISGMNHNVKIMALKILDSDGSGYGADEVNAYHYINKALNLGVNVVAINNSWGGGGSSEIFEKLMNLVGEKGAVSVCAAGNDGADNDEEEDYPSAYESAYKINVAASNEKNELASFSNFGKQTVDIAAPGSDILSTVSYDCYNPSLYNTDKQKTVSQKFNDFEGNVDAELEWNITPEMFFNINADKDTSNYKIETVTDKYFGETEGKSLKLSFGTLAAGECAGIRIPYTVNGEEEKNLLQFSMMARPNGPSAGSETEGVFWVADVPKGTEVPSDEMGIISFLINYENIGLYVDGQSDDWTHLNLECGSQKESPEKDRELIVFFMANVKGEYDVYLDDIGLSKEGTEFSEFGKYDFYSGTSMAAPHVAGAIALEASENPKATVEEVIDNVLCYVKEEPSLADKTVTGGCLDFSKKIAASARIGDISVDVNKKQIVIKGSGFDAADLEAKVIKGDKEEKANIVKKDKSTLVLSDNGWINHVVTISITGNGKTNTKKDVYLVKGKPSYTAVNDFEFTGSDIMTTDGRNIYSANSMSDSIDIIDTTDSEYMEFEPVFYVKAEKYFKKDSDSLGEYDFTFGKDLVYMDGKLYNIAAYSEVAPTDFEDYDDEDRSTKQKEEDDMDGEDGEMGSSGGVAYSSQYKLMCFNPETETIENLGELPTDVRQTEDWTLAGYNGNLYLIGGYDYKKKDCSKVVKIYTPSTKKWTNGPSLPEGRAGGKAIQNGNRLIYTMGYSSAQKGVEISAQTCPVNLILNGNQWQVSKRTICPYVVQKPIVYGGNAYNVYSAGVGLCAEGIIYFGTPVEGLGDTFIYNVSKDEYQAMKYSQIKTLDGENTFTGIAIGGALYGFNQEGQTYKIAINSGLVKAAAGKMSKGKIVNANIGFVPGTAVKLTVKPKKGYAVKEFKVDGKKIKGNSTTVRLTSNIKTSASFGKAVSKIKLNKKKVTLKPGKTFKLKVKITPKDAVSKKVTYKSSNKKYATVSKKGVVKAKKAGKGKTVTITVTAADGSNKKAKCKVKIK